MIYENNIKINFTVSNPTTVTYILEKDGKEIKTGPINSNELELIQLDAGNYTINITYPEDKNHESTTQLLNISVNKAKQTMNADDIKISIVNQKISLDISSQTPIKVQYQIYMIRKAN